MRQRGFTLLELLLALSIFALVAAMAYGGLNHILSQAQAVEQRALALKELQGAMLLLEQDLYQSLERPIRDEFGSQQAAMVSADQGEYLLQFTRAGYANPVLPERGSLARIAYGLDDDGHLIRYLWQTLDRAQGSEPYSARLVSGVKALQWRFLNPSSKEWEDSWPSAQATGDALPLAVEMSLESEQFGVVRRIFPILVSG